MKFRVSPEDFLKGKILNPGWYPSVITSYDEKESKGVDQQGNPKEKSTYIEMQFKIVAPGDVKGVVVYQNFSEKAQAFIVPLVEALTKKTFNKKEVVELDIAREKFINQQVDIHVIRGSYNNKPKNDIDGYRPYSGPSVTQAPAQAGV